MRRNRKIPIRPKDRATRAQLLELLLGPDGLISVFKSAADAESAWADLQPKLSPAFANQWYAAGNRKSFAPIAEQYARDVLSGAIPAGLRVRQACQRHLTDLARAARPNPQAEPFPFIFDSAKADRACRFIELLPHVKGKWAANAERMCLAPWQIFVVCCIFGWIKRATGQRRFSLAYIEVPRKNGKSQLAAGIGHYLFACDNEFGAEVYSGATTEDQAYEVFRPARQMMVTCPELAEVLGLVTVKPTAKGLRTLDTAARFEPVIGRPGDGASPHCGIVDEYHEHASDALFDTLRTGMGARSQPLLLAITTAGDNMAGPCKLLHNDMEEILKGAVTRDECFAIIYEIDADDDWANEATLAKANPNIDVSVSREFLVTEMRAALANPRKQGVFKTKHLDIWVGTVASYFDVRAWAALADPTLTPDAYTGQLCVISVDLSSKRDFTARIVGFRRILAGKEHFYLFPRFYLPEQQVLLPENQHYQGWQRTGHIIVHPGSTVDFERIAADTVNEVRRYKAREFCFDPWNALQFAQQVERETKTPVVEIRQTVQFLSAPMKEFDTLIAEGRVHHDGNPVMTWMLGNVKAKEDANENVFPRKEDGRAENKIDGAVAGIMALSRLMVAPAKRSVYSTRGILTLSAAAVGVHA